MENTTITIHELAAADRKVKTLWALYENLSADGDCKASDLAFCEYADAWRKFEDYKEALLG